MLFLLFALVWAQPQRGSLKKYLSRIQTQSHTPLLVVISPGWNEEDLDPLLSSLWSEGFNLWTLHFPYETQTSASVSADSRNAITSFSQAPIVVSHDFAGSLIVQDIAPVGTIMALALFSSPLNHRCAPALEQALQETDEDELWEMLGDPALRESNPLWRDYIVSLCRNPPRPSIENISMPIWAATSNINNVAPPESIRPFLHPNHTFFRPGPLNLNRIEPNSNEILSHPPTTKILLQWLRRVAR
ncbi:MAG: hypothetical protein VX278_10090 [Myxococcota bacterium]|nr:hypothetical protein [Myxococcota bacterium]